MPYVKRLSIKNGVKNSINYITDNKKETEYVSNALNYITNESKVFNIYGYNCSSNPILAEQEMQMVKKQFNKIGKVQGYHYIQSFAPNEVTPELSYKIGKEFVENTFPNHQVLMSTHIDKGHIHNHFIVNSVNIQNGKKLDSANKTLYYARDISDEISKKYNIRIIDNKIKKLHEHKSDYVITSASNKYDATRSTIDKLIAKSESYYDFKQNLIDAGYKVKENKYLTVIPPDYVKPVRTNTLGQMYTRDLIKKRIENKDIEFDKYISKDMQDGLRKLSRNEKNEKLIDVIDQINFLNRYKINVVGDFEKVKNQINESLKNIDEFYFKISKQESACINLISDIKYLKSHHHIQDLTQDEKIKINSIITKLEKNSIPFEQVDKLLVDLELKRDSLTIKTNEVKNNVLNTKNDMKVLCKLIKENEMKRETNFDR